MEALLWATHLLCVAVGLIGGWKAYHLDLKRRRMMHTLKVAAGALKVAAYAVVILLGLTAVGVGWILL